MGYMFVLDDQIGEFVLAKPNVKIPEDASILSFNEANLEAWDEPFKNLVNKWRVGEGASGKKFSSRYIGAMVGDVHRTLLYGGVLDTLETQRTQMENYDYCMKVHQ